MTRSLPLSSPLFPAVNNTKRGILILIVLSFPASSPSSDHTTSFADTAFADLFTSSAKFLGSVGQQRWGQGRFL